MQSISYLILFIFAAFVTEGHSTTASKCPDGQPEVKCKVDPCQLATCEGDPTAICHADYCGGCNARWVTKKGTPAQCNPKQSCPPGQTLYQCLVNPCQLAKCEGDPKATCHADYCGGCNARWVTKEGKPAQCNRKKSCPPGQTLYQCLVDPCQLAKCEGDPKATCHADYCGGCNARWVTKEGKPAQCDAKKCPHDRPPVNCLKDPCQGQKCRRHRNAKCISDYCGGCFYKWVLNGRRVHCH